MAATTRTLQPSSDAPAMAASTPSSTWSGSGLIVSVCRPNGMRQPTRSVVPTSMASSAAWSAWAPARAYCHYVDLQPAGATSSNFRADWISWSHWAIRSISTDWRHVDETADHTEKHAHPCVPNLFCPSSKDAPESQGVVVVFSPIEQVDLPYQGSV